MNIPMLSSQDSSKNNFNIETSYSTCTPISAPYCEGFEDSSWVFSYPNFAPGLYGSIGDCWTRSDSINYWWNSQSGASTWSFSGPSSGAGGSGKYLYTQPGGSIGSQPGVTNIVTPWFDLTALDTPAVFFKSHLYGSNIVDLELEIDNGNGWFSLLTLPPFQQSRNAPWKQNIVNLISYQYDTVRFRLTASRSGSRAKIAVDDFCLDEAPYCPPVLAAFYDFGNFLSRGFVASGVPNNAQCTWDFGDGTFGSGTPAFHTYSSPGSYNVKLAVQLNCGSRDTISQTVNICSTLGYPVFSYQVSGLTYDFQISSGGIGSSGFIWDFGDGTFGSGTTVSHTYYSAGLYDVILKSYDNCGDTNSYSSIIDICDPSAPISANWTATILSTSAQGMKAQFNGDVSIGATNYKWYFGDGDSGVGKIIIHTYSTPGLFYDVSLVASNDCTGSDTKTKSLTTVGVKEFGYHETKIWPTILSPGELLHFKNKSFDDFQNPIKIINSLGRLISGHSVPEGIEIPIYWPRGIYYVIIDGASFRFQLI